MYPEWWNTTGVPTWKGEWQFVETLGKDKARYGFYRTSVERESQRSFAPSAERSVTTQRVISMGEHLMSDQCPCDCWTPFFRTFLEKHWDTWVSKCSMNPYTLFHES